MTDRHRRLLELLEDTLDQADIRLTAAAKTRLRWTLTDLADADHLELIQLAEKDRHPSSHPMR